MMRVHVYDFCEKAGEYAETKSLATAVECARLAKEWMERITGEVEGNTEPDQTMEGLYEDEGLKMEKRNGQIGA